MLRKRLISIGLGLAILAGSFSGNIQNANAAEKWTFSQPFVRPLSNTFYKIFCERVKEYTNGRIEVELFIDGLLANHDETFHGIQDGSITLGIISPYVNLIPGGIMNWMPWATTSWEEAEIVFDTKSGVLHNVMEKAYQEVGMHVLFHVSYGPYGIGNTVRPLQAPADLKNMKLRVSSSLGPVRALEGIGKGTGMTLQTTPWTEIYNSISKGVVDGCWMHWPSLVDERIYEVLKYFTDFNIIWDNQNIVINKEVWDRQPQDIKDAVSRAAAEVQKLSNDGTRKLQDEYIKKMQAEKGLTLTFLTPEQREVFIKASNVPAIWKELCDPWLEKAYPGQNMSQKIQAELEKVRAEVHTKK